MFGTMGFSELIIILVIVLIIFGAGRLPQIGEGVGKALKGFKKEVNEIPTPVEETQAPPPEIQAQTQTAPEANPNTSQTTTPPPVPAAQSKGLLLPGGKKDDPASCQLRCCHSEACASLEPPAPSVWRYPISLQKP